ncbi:hypothetical protein CYLTODRAFT_416608 [Cylindrobasidium torrendii FP15055 ss-10]|uniref:Uncharacterized protein n=1 Tax=Cylindrobasidium torrendii FP15055 ss-10 TaxID=1314674 RepID=A0A0D7BUU6_9AGAR|nr:hypothetical protein CYLTODRAFT_416608 [Cylindrobasidium torrendii FP15055 ss-10]
MSVFLSPVLYNSSVDGHIHRLYVCVCKSHVNDLRLATLEIQIDNTLVSDRPTYRVGAPG